MPEEVTYQYIPFAAKGDDSSRVVEGYVSSGDVDLDQQIVDQGWLKRELPVWLARFGNIREQHDPQRAVGKAQSVDLDAAPGPYLAAKIVDDVAWRKVKEGVYNGFSVGIKGPKIVRDATARNGRIVGGTLIEVSVVDRPANDAAKFTLVKRVEGGWKDMQSGAVVEGTSLSDSLPGAGRENPDARTGASLRPLPGAGTADAGRAVGLEGSEGTVSTEVTTVADGGTAGDDAARASLTKAPVTGASPGMAADGGETTSEASGPEDDLAGANDAPGTPARPAIVAELEALFAEVRTRVEALAGQTDRDRDGDVDSAANMAAGGMKPAADFAEGQGQPEPIAPETLTLGFSTRADLEKFIGERVEAQLRARSAEQEVVTKAATEAQAVGIEAAKLAARGLVALADETKAVKEELAALKAGQAATEADLARVKDLAQPVKGSVFAVDKGIGLEPDRINSDGTSKTAIPARGSVEWLAKQVAALSEEERTALAQTAYRQFAPGRGGV